MEKLYNTVYHELAKHLLSIIDTAYPESGSTIESIARTFGATPDISQGHLAFPCFIVAKAAKKAPPLVANEICQKISHELIATCKVSGPYVNIYFNIKKLGEILLNEIYSGEYFKKPLIKNAQKTMIEYSQPNTHKELHVGHMRNLCLGNALVRLYRYAGVPTVAVTFPGDVGTHVAKCLWYMKYHNQEVAPKNNQGAWLGRMYAKGNLKLEDELGSASEANNRLQLTEILKQLEKKQGNFFDLWKETREWSLALFNQTYAWADVKFDRWFYESEVDSASLEYARELFAAGKLVQDQGAIGLDLSENKLGFCLLIKTDGTGLYATKDIELARRKFQEFNIEKSIYVVDKRQALHFKQVFKVLEHIGFKEAKNCFHLEYDFVELPTGAMSSRKGNIVPLMDLVEQMEQSITQNYLEKYRGVWSDAEIKSTAHMVANGAIKYGMLKMDNNKSIVFEMNEWLKLDGETGPYLQYVHARINSLLEKQGYAASDKTSWGPLVALQEQALAVKIISFNNVIENSVINYRPSTVCAYLYDLCKLFNSFYAECSIARAENNEIKAARLSLAYATSQVLKQGLAILGIPAPDKM
jgi:arginyl-tRNA synthetase